MTLAPLLSAPPLVLAHAAAALAALAAGAVALAMRKGAPRHAAVGRVFATAMLFVAVSSFWITSVTPGSFSPIHALSLVTLFTIPLAIWRRRQGDIRAHAIGMTVNYAALLIAGGFTLAPHRLLGQVVFWG